MKTFQELLAQERIEFSVSGQMIDTALTLEQALELVRAAGGLIEERGLTSRDGTKLTSFYQPIKTNGIPVFSVVARAERAAQAAELGIPGLQTQIAMYIDQDEAMGEREFRRLLGYHVEKGIAAITYFIFEIEAVNPVRG